MTSRRLSVAMSTDLAARLREHLCRADGQEDLCFLLWRPSTGARRTSAVVYEAILPERGDRDVHGNAAFHDSYFLRAAQAAAAAGAGLALVHSHPRGVGWQRLSPHDHEAEAGHAAQTIVITGFPLVGLTLACADMSWSARFWERVAPRTYAPAWCESARVIGGQIRVSWNPAIFSAPSAEPSQLRTVSAWGAQVQADLARLHVGIVGAGSVGNLVGEALARMGLRRFTLIDFDIVKEHNRDRLLYATTADVQHNQRKVHVLARGMRESATAPDVHIEPHPVSVVEPDGLASALDCDVIFSCVDRPWPRAVLNLAAYAHLIPVIDGGVRISTTRDGLMRGAEWRSHMAAPGRACMECLGQYDPADVALERSGMLDDPNYIAGLPSEHGLRRNENVFPFSMAAAADEVNQLIRAVAAPSGISDVGARLHHFTTGAVDQLTDPCTDTCPYSGQLLVSGDQHGLQVTQVAR